MKASPGLRRRRVMRGTSPAGLNRMLLPLPIRWRKSHFRSNGTSDRSRGNLMLATTEPNSDLLELEQRVRFELDCLGYPARQWTSPRSQNGTPVHDVIIVGGGPSGLSIAFRLLRERITNLRMLDRTQDGLHE